MTKIILNGKSQNYNLYVNEDFVMFLTSKLIMCFNNGFTLRKKIPINCLFNTPSVSYQKLHLDIICVTKQKIRFVKFFSNFVKRIGMLL